MSKIKILDRGLLTSLQDLGRTGYQKYGVPVSGAMDEYSHKIANFLVGNAVGEATLEATLVGPKILFMGEHRIAITGGDLQPKINNKAIDMWQGMIVKKGDVLSFAGVKKGLRAYIAFGGGFAIDAPMGSQSYYKKAKIGTTIKNEQVLEIREKSPINRRVLEKKYIPNFEKKINCKVILGPQNDYFTREGINNFFTSEYKIGKASDRMGYRLLGNKIMHQKSPDIISDALGKGAIQIPGNGQPIIMMSDAQTTGGYPKIGYVIKEDLDKLSQLMPGDRIGFTEISIGKAQERYLKYMRKFDAIKKQLVMNQSVDYYRIYVNGKPYDVSIEAME